MMLNRFTTETQRNGGFSSCSGLIRVCFFICVTPVRTEEIYIFSLSGKSLLWFTLKPYPLLELKTYLHELNEIEEIIIY